MIKYKIPKSISKEFKKGIADLITQQGRKVTVCLPDVVTDCPNCLYDSVTRASAGVYDLSFIRPVYIFPNTDQEKIIYPRPFNVSEEIVNSGVVYDPNIVNPGILNTTICPVCKGKGVLTTTPTVCIKAIVTWDPKSPTHDGTMVEYSAGRFNSNIARLKTYPCNYAVCREAKKFTVDGVSCEIFRPAHVKGIGGEHLVELHVQTTQAIDDSVTRSFDNDDRININPLGYSSNQADEYTPNNPSTNLGDEEW